MRKPKKERKILVPETLRELEVGESTYFKREEVDSSAVSTAAYRIKKKDGRQFSTRINGKIIIATRVA